MQETARSKIMDLLWSLEMSGNSTPQDLELVEYLRKVIDAYYKVTIRFD